MKINKNRYIFLQMIMKIKNNHKIKNWTKIKITMRNQITKFKLIKYIIQFTRKIQKMHSRKIFKIKFK